ncbi:UNVERIFIED_CONTAM: hypothetical protein Sradi_4534900 [Sesamum radiatum]|uniref:Reverse transcriptase domain-containing protein n=1 Tax=Sesamum radiatum TaxID=300843 RepID=A0AAW2NCM5_SESRA
MKQPSKPPLKGFVASTQEEEGRHEALAIDEKRFDPKAFKLFIKAGYNSKEKLSLGKLPPETSGKKLHGLNATQMILKEKGHAIQDFRVGLDFTPPKPVRIAIKRVNNNYVSKGFSSTEDHKREENFRKFVFNRLGPHIQALHEIANRQSVFDRLGPYGKVEEEDAEDAPVELEEGIKATIDELKEVNLGDIENLQPIYIRASLTQEEEETYIALLHEFKDVFAWSYKEMPGDLNNAFPKDDFSLPIAELMIDVTTGNEALSFMDGSSGYNQICMASTDEELTELFDDLPDEDVLVIEVMPPWKMYFDGASHKEGVGAGIVFVTLEGELGDVELEHLSKKDNKQADALAKFASTLPMTDKETHIPICKSWVIPPIFSDDEDDTFQEEENHITKVFEVEEEDWQQPLVDYLKYEKLPNDLRRRTDTRRQATRFIYYKGTLYRRSFDGIFLRCLSDNEKFKLWKKLILGFVMLTNQDQNYISA